VSYFDNSQNTSKKILQTEKERETMIKKKNEHVLNVQLPASWFKLVST